jgi:hypothetical protein
MSNPSGPDQGNEPAVDSTDESVAEQPPEVSHDTPTEAAPIIEEHPTEIIASDEVGSAQTKASQDEPAERRYTAPSGMDSSTTKFIETPADPATEVFSAPTQPVAPQVIPPRGDAPKPPRTRRSWGWVVALILVIAALVAIAILGTLLLTRDSKSKASQEEMVRSTIQNFDAAVQKGDLATLRSITCGTTRDSYVNYDDRAWADTHTRVAAAKQYPVVASIDQVVVNGDHAEANVTTFMAYAPQTRSTRSFDLQFRDEQWKICQAANS